MLPGDDDLAAEGKVRNMRGRCRGNSRWERWIKMLGLFVDSSFVLLFR